MLVQLSPALETLVREKVSSGRYRDEAEVFSEALRLLERRDLEAPWPAESGMDDGARLEALRAAIAKGRESAARGDVIVLEDDTAIDAFFDALDAR